MTLKLFVEFPNGFLDMDIEEVLEKTSYRFIEDEDEVSAEQEAKRLGLPWPAWIARNEHAYLCSVMAESDDLDTWARETIEAEHTIRKYPSEFRCLGSGCCCGMLGGSCGCGPSCTCHTDS